MTSPKIVIDTCVIESAIRSKRGASFQVLQSIEHRHLFSYGLSVSLTLEYEYRMFAMVAEKKTPLTHDETNAILAALTYFADEVTIFYTIRPNLGDENDNHVFECCINYGADILVTHNLKDFNNADLRPYNLRVLSPGNFMKEYLQ